MLCAERVRAVVLYLVALENSLEKDEMIEKLLFFRKMLWMEYIYLRRLLIVYMYLVVSS